MPGHDAVSFSLVTLDALRPVLANQPLGNADITLRVASARLTAPIEISGAPPIVIRFKAGTELSLFVRNGKTASDLRDIVEAGPLDAWVEYVCAADVGVDAKVPGGAATFAGRTTATVTLSDYRHHSSDTGVATAVARDLSGPRVALVREHVLSLGPKDALAFETRGELTASVDVDWSDIFTSEIGLLTRLLDARGPIAIETTIGATCSARVSVTDSFLVAFARGNQDGSLRVAVRKGEVRKTDIGAGLSIGVAIDDRGAVERLVDEMLDKIGLGALRELPVPVPDIRARVVDAIEDVAKTKIGAAFEYEYQRVDSAATVFEATIAPGQLSPALHAALVCGNLAPALSAPPSVITISRYLNDRTATVSRAWGFTLGIGKWQVFGRDRRRLTRVVRFDATRQVEQRSYIGSGGYERTHLKWMVDFKAGMRGWAAKPVVADFDLGLHVAWIRDLQTFDAGDLDTALDFAALWKICPDGSLAWLRERLSPIVGQEAEWSFHVRVNDAELRPLVRAVAAMTPVDLAGAAAAAMEPGAGGRPPSARRALFAPLWRAVLASAERYDAETIVRMADEVLSDPRAAWREREVANARTVEPDTVAGIVSSNPGMFEDCARLIRGCRTLAGALDASAGDDGVIEEAYSDLAPFWSQSHQVRMLGALVTDLAPDPDRMDRAMNVRSGTSAIVISWRRPPYPATAAGRDRRSDG